MMLIIMKMTITIISLCNSDADNLILKFLTLPKIIIKQIKFRNERNGVRTSAIFFLHLIFLPILVQLFFPFVEFEILRYKAILAAYIDKERHEINKKTY